MSRRGLVLALCVASIATAAPLARAEQFVSFFGGYSLNDPKTGAEDGPVYGLRWGTETPAAGGQLSLTINEDDDVKMNSLTASALLNFASTDRRTSRGRLIMNSFSAFGVVGAGVTRWERPGKKGPKKSTLFTWELGVGLQWRFHRRVGLRSHALALGSDFRNYQGTLEIAVYW